MPEMTNGMARAAARFCRAAQRAYAGKWSFLGAFALVLLVSFIVLYSLGLTPDATAADASPVMGVATSTPLLASVAPELPVTITIPTINLNVTVSDPTTTDTTVLDKDLLSGAVHYPTSAELGENGNVVIFGHSSYLPVVGNQAYKTFDGIQKLKVGDTITVDSSDMAYTYSVVTVKEESAASDAGIPLDVSGQVLTLSTCDSFATKSDRFVVTADFVESHPLGA